MLLQAALSHLDLALINVSEQSRHHEFNADQRSQLFSTVTKLQKLASRQEEEKVLSLDSLNTIDLATFDVQTRTGHGPGVADQGLQSKRIDGEMHVQQRAIQDSEKVLPSDVCEAASGTNLEAIDMLKIMIEAFNEVCQVDSFAVPWDTLHTLSINLGFRGSAVQAVMHRSGRPHDGIIFEEEWIGLAKEMLALHKPDEIIGMIKMARRRKISGHRLSSTKTSTKFLRSHMQHRFTLSCKSRTRVVWDMFIMVLLIYVALALPVTFAFDDLHTMQTIDFVLDWIFLCDVLINFRTTFINELREEEWHWKAIAQHYLRSWFALDLVSSLPLEQLSNGLLPRLQSAKLLKFGKLAKATKVFRLSKLAKMWAGSEVMELLEEFLWSKNLNTISQVCMILVQLCISGHWGACLLLACDGSAVDEYLARSVHGLQKYTVALYWAITTMTTVGYGDVAMQTEWERIYAILAMMAGGTFYGYIVGVVTTILSHRDADQRAFRERMDTVADWLKHHYELSPALRRRVWRHFKEYLTAKRAVEDSMILNDLPPELCKDVSEALLADSVRHNQYFENVSIKAICALVAALTQVKCLANEVIVNEGDTGKAMFIVDRGFLDLERGGAIQHLCGGNSFGVEIILRDVKEYTYTVKTRSKVCLYKIFRNDFEAAFKDLQKDLMIILDNFYRAKEERERLGHPVLHASPGAASLLKGGPTGIPSDFSNVVLEHFNQLLGEFKHIPTEKPYALSHPK